MIPPHCAEGLVVVKEKKASIQICTGGFKATEKQDVETEPSKSRQVDSLQV
jgi:hypothetical protein